MVSRVTPTREKKRTYGRDYQCLCCEAKNDKKYILGFCRWCYGRYSRGIIDFYGKPKREPKKRFYPKGATCIVSDCIKRPRGRGFCDSHLHAFLKTKTINARGCRIVPRMAINKGMLCSVDSCGKPAKCKGYCVTHYSRLQTTGVAYKDRHDNPNWKNVGKVCLVDGCTSMARTRAMCSKHYPRYMRRLNMSQKNSPP